MAKIMNLVDSKMVERMQAPVNPLHRTLNSLDSNMQSILQRVDMSDEEKVQAYNQILQRFLEYKRTEEGSTKPSIVQTNPAFDVEKDVLRTIPMTMKRKAAALMERMKDDPDVAWNDRGEFVYKGNVIVGSNMVDLVNDMMRQRKGFEPRGRFEFARALRHTNVPQDLVGNRGMWGWMHRDSATSDAFSTAEESLDERTPPRSRSLTKTPARKRVRKKVKNNINWENLNK